MINEDLPVRLTNDDSPVWTLWASLCGIQIYDNNTLVPSRSNELIPILLSDPSALMLKFILLAPLQLDLGELHIFLKQLEINTTFKQKFIFFFIKGFT